MDKPMKQRKQYILEKCPFCGGNAVLERSHRAFVNRETTRVAFVRCKKCNARTGRFELREFGKTSHSEEACNLAVAAWNRRVNDDR